MADDTLSVDPDDLAHGGLRFNDVSHVSKNVHVRLADAHNRYPNIGGNGQIGGAFEENYYAAAKSALDFAAGIAKLLDTHGGKTLDLAKLFNGVNDTTVDDVSGIDPTTAPDPVTGHRPVI
jgi:hypothetical protein